MKDKVCEDTVQLARRLPPPGPHMPEQFFTFQFPAASCAPDKMKRHCASRYWFSSLSLHDDVNAFVKMERCS